MVYFLMGLHAGEGLGFDHVVGPADVEVEGLDGGVVELPVENFLADVFDYGVLGVGDVEEDLFKGRLFLF